jgi:sugar/nucleoside kinase (ribokinase family)
VEGKLVEEPKILTGGGDNFNAGYALGCLMELEMEERLLLGMGCSGTYIQNGKSPDLSELGEYLES